MKNTLKISLLGNLALAALVVWLARMPRVSDAPPAPLAREIAAAAPVVPAAQTRHEASNPPAPSPFRWSQIESSDYHTYMANLRRIGCPEQTIREIISSDVDDLYNLRRQELQRRLALGDSVGANFTRHQAMEKGLRQLQDEEAGVLQALLGVQPSSAQVAADAPAPAEDSVIQALQTERNLAKSTALPIVLQPMNPQTLDLNEQELEFMNEVRRDFERDIGGAGQDPNDPAYLERWQKAQAKSDAMMITLLGQVRYQAHAQEIYAQSLIAQHISP